MTFQLTRKPYRSQTALAPMRCNRSFPQTPQRHTRWHMRHGDLSLRFQAAVLNRLKSDGIVPPTVIEKGSRSKAGELGVGSMVGNASGSRPTSAKLSASDFSGLHATKRSSGLSATCMLFCRTLFGLDFGADIPRVPVDLHRPPTSVDLSEVPRLILAAPSAEGGLLTHSASSSSSRTALEDCAHWEIRQHGRSHVG